MSNKRNGGADAVAEHVACTLCGADETRLLFRPKNSPGPVVQCLRCTLTYVCPREDPHALIADGPVVTDLSPSLLNSNDPRVIANGWELPLIKDKELEYPALERNAALTLAHIERYIRPPGRLLDHGCGGGFFLSVAEKHGWESYGLEPLLGHAIYARSRSKATVVADTLHENTFPPAYFDVVTAFQVFEHLPDPSEVIGKIKRLLKPGGIVLIEVPNIDTWAVQLLRQYHRHFVQDHLYFFSPKTLRMLVVKHGFEPLLTYRPKRYMTLHHLFERWGKGLLGARPAHVMLNVLRKIGIENRTVAVGIGDIVAIVARA